MDNKTNINWYPGHMAKTKREILEKIKLVDIVYELVDARIPFSSKIKDIDEYIKDKPKFIVMTKKDLCDISVTNKWVKYYESLGYNVILMDVNNNKDYLDLIKRTHDIMSKAQKVRIEKGLKEKEVKALVVGVPNVGKSTLINKLVGKKVAQTGNRPGVTKSTTWLKTKHNILLLDTPGMLWPKIDNNDEALNLASTAAIKNEILNITDIGGYIVSFLKNNYPNILQERYKLASLDDDPIVIMDDIAKKIGAISKGEVDYEKVSLRIYNDILTGAIKGVTFDLWKTIY